MADRLQNEINFGINGPVQVNYEYCKGCGAQGPTCCNSHRYFTYEGYLSVMMNFYSDENTPDKVLDMAQQAEEFFPGGFEHGEIGICKVCGRPDCNRPHRKYTREGYAKFQIEIMGIGRRQAMKGAVQSLWWRLGMVPDEQRAAVCATYECINECQSTTAADGRLALKPRVTDITTSCAPLKQYGKPSRQKARPSSSDLETASTNSGPIYAARRNQSSRCCGTI